MAVARLYFLERQQRMVVATPEQAVLSASSSDSRSSTAVVKFEPSHGKCAHKSDRPVRGRSGVATRPEAGRHDGLCHLQLSADAQSPWMLCCVDGHSSQMPLPLSLDGSSLARTARHTLFITLVRRKLATCFGVLTLPFLPGLLSAMLSRCGCPPAVEDHRTRAQVFRVQSCCFLWCGCVFPFEYTSCV